MQEIEMMQGSNAPDFDPLNATEDEETGMMRGYLAAGIAPRGTVCPGTASVAFEHGWRMRRNDQAGVADDDQREMAHKLSRKRA